MQKISEGLEPIAFDLMTWSYSISLLLILLMLNTFSQTGSIQERILEKKRKKVDLK